MMLHHRERPASQSENAHHGFAAPADPKKCRRAFRLRHPQLQPNNIAVEAGRPLEVTNGKVRLKEAFNWNHLRSPLKAQPAETVPTNRALSHGGWHGIPSAATSACSPFFRM